MDEALVREVEPEEAEAVLTLQVFIPGVAEGVEDRHYLSRRPPPSRVEVESVTVNPDGSVTERVTVTITKGALVAHCSHADGRTPDGRGCGYGKTVSVAGWRSGGVAVRVSMYWTGRDGRHGDLDEELVVPWPGRARRELGRGAWMAAEITSVGSPAEAPAASDAGRG